LFIAGALGAAHAGHVTLTVQGLRLVDDFMNVMAGQPDGATREEMRHHLNQDCGAHGGPPPLPPPSPPPPGGAPPPPPPPGCSNGALCRKKDPKIATSPITQSRSKDQIKDKDNSLSNHAVKLNIIWPESFTQ